MPFVRKVGTFLDEVLEFLLSVVHHWRGALTSSVVISVGLTVYQLATNEALKLKPYLWTLVGVGLPVAVFLAWAEEYRGRERGQLEINQLKLAPAPDVSAMQEALMHSRNDTDRQREEIGRLTKQVEILTVERPRIITPNQIRQIAESLRAWPAYRDMPYNRRAIVFASPQGFDAKNYAGQIRLALERGLIWTEEVIDFTHGDETYLAGEHAELNQHLLNAHDANVTIWGSDTIEHSGDPLDQALLDAFRVAGVDAVHHPGPTSFGGMVAVIVGRGTATRSSRQEEEIARLNEELNRLKPRSITDRQREIIVAHLAPVIADYVSAGRHLQVTVNAMPSSDCAAYARDFEELLSSSGLSVHRYPKPPITYIGSLDNADDLRIGVTVLFNPERFRVPYPQALIAGLEEAGITVNVLERDGAGIFFNVIIGDRA